MYGRSYLVHRNGPIKTYTITYVSMIFICIMDVAITPMQRAELRIILCREMAPCLLLAEVSKYTMPSARLIPDSMHVSRIDCLLK